VKPTAAEIASLRQLPKEERELEDKLPKHLPIKVRIRPEKEKAFKDLDNDNWIRDLEVEVKNTGTRPIYYMVLLVDMPELKFGQGNMVFDLRFGHKKFMNFASGAKPEDLALKPGETCILDTRTPLDWNEYSRDMNWPRPKQFVLKFQEISFGDGTGFRTTGGVPWPEPPRKPGPGACLQGPGPYPSTEKANNLAWKFRLGGEPASFLPAKFSYAANPLFLGTLKSSLDPSDSCCTGDSCYWVYEYEDENACYGYPCDAVPRADYVFCADSRGHCRTYEVTYRTCVVNEDGYHYTHNCPIAVTGPCGSISTPSPSPSPSPVSFSIV